MTRDNVKSLSDGELAQVSGWLQEEQKLRSEKRKAEAIVKIKERQNQSI